MSTVLDKLPKGWVLSTLGELCEPSQYGYTTKAGASGNYHFLRTTDITKPQLDWDKVPYCTLDEAEAGKYLLKDGDIVISRAGSIGFSALILNPRKSVFASYLIRFRPLIDKKYLNYFLSTPSYWASISKGSSGIAVQNVNAKTLSAIKLPLAPAKEQTRIVEKLEELFSDLDNGVAELKAAQIKLTQYRQSLLKSAVEGTLTQEWREANANKISETGEKLLARILKERRQRWEQQKREEFASKNKAPPKDWQKKYPEPVQPDTSDLPELPEGWVWASLSQLGWLDRGKSKHRPRNADFLYGGKYPFVQTGDIRNADTYIKEVSKTYSEQGLAQSRLWPAGTMCITIAANIGETALLSFDACFPDSVVGFLPTVREMKNEFVEYAFRTRKQKLEDEAPATAQKNINLDILSRVVLPLPSLAEQELIVEKLQNEFDEIEMRALSIKDAMKSTEVQRKNILKDAFSGKLAEQDPSDEPASVLLEKIKAERKLLEKSPKPKRPRKKSATMKKMDIDSLKGWISDQNSNGFTFEQLQSQFNTDYEELKDMVFLLLSESKPICEQFFDNDLGQVVFKKVGT